MPEAILASVMVASATLFVVMALLAILGSAELPVKSPVSCTMPLLLIVASGAPLET